MDELDSLKSSLDRKRNELKQRQREKKSYLSKAEEIDTLYDSLCDDKESLIRHRNSVRDFARENYKTFSGNLHKNTYYAQMECMLNNYKTVINRLDENIDRLNTQKAYYENQAYECNGIIGHLQSAINSLVHEIENWTN